MKILLLCNKSPWPPLEGGPIAMNAMVTGLIQAGHQVKVLAINSNKYKTDLQSVPEDYLKQTGLETVYVDLSIKPWPALVNLLKGNSYHVERFFTKEFTDVLTVILKGEEFDIIQFETLYTSPYLPLIRRLSGAKVILRAHNIEHLLWERIAAGCRNPLKKIYLNHLAGTLQQFETKMLNQVDGIVAITEKDADFFRQAAPKTPVMAIPFGIDTRESALPVKKPSLISHPTLFHLGSMNWIPNQEGISWFIRKVWPEVHARNPELKFHLAGREMPFWLKNLKTPGIVVDGEVPDAMAYMQSHSIMVVPLFSGSGIRIKIIEGMLAGKAIITTAVGAEGIECTHGTNILFAEDVRSFEKEIDKCLKTPGLIEELGKNAHDLVIKNHDNDRLMQNITDFYLNINH